MTCLVVLASNQFFIIGKNLASPISMRKRVQQQGAFALAARYQWLESVAGI